MPATISFDPVFRAWDQRGDRLRRRHYMDVGHPSEGQALLVLCPRWVATQIEEAAGDACESHVLESQDASRFNYGYSFEDGVDDDIVDLVELLREVVSIPAPEYVDHALALDFYTAADSESGDLEHTAAGNWIHWTKHASNPTYGNSRKARREMIDALVDTIQRHPLLSEAAVVIAAPGHKGDGLSFGEALAREVAQKVGKSFVESTSPGSRPEQKTVKQDLTHTFTVSEAISGTVLIIDDVYQSGGSASGAAAAARRAGADSVVFLAVARTIRK